MKSPESLKSPEKEQVVSCAVMFGNQVFTAGNHGEAYMLGMDEFPEEKNILDGYVTSKGRFVTREDGNRIMRGEKPLDEFESLK